MPPSPFVIQWAPRIAGLLVTQSRQDPPGRRPVALDVAMGRGRHVDVLTNAGFRVFGVDRDLDAVREAKRQAAVPLAAWCADLTAYPLPARRFDLVIVTRYLQRDLFSALKGAVAPGGFLLYETFTRHQLAHSVGPRSPSHLLEPGELRSLGHDFEIVSFEEPVNPDAVAQLVARRPR
jgi:SAM-dependent methyltransferase